MENIDTHFLQKCIYMFNLKSYKFQFSKIQVWTYNQMEIFSWSYLSLINFRSGKGY